MNSKVFHHLCFSFATAYFAMAEAPLVEEEWLNGNSSSTDATILYNYHPVMVDEDGAIIPWFSSNLGQAYDDALFRTWKWFSARENETDPSVAGEKHYMFHQVWTREHDMRGIGGDQVAQFLCSLDLFYNYSGDPAMLEEMIYQADYYLARSLSPADCRWPHLPFPYNTETPNTHSGSYDGDMILGRDITQPDKAGSLGAELVKLYKKTGKRRYLDASIRIADTLAGKVQAGDGNHSPLPFKVNAFTGEVGSNYTTNFTGALEMFAALDAMGFGDIPAYAKATSLITEWMKQFPATNQKWGPFFEDVTGWSDTQINALTYARYLLNNPSSNPNWRDTVPRIFDWAHERLGNKEFSQFKVNVINEQTSYPVPGQSHSSRQAAAEIQHWALTGDASRLRNAIRMLSWGTYSINFDGANRYPRDAIWYSDGYGDYWRHLLRAMAAAPQLAPDDSNHLLESSSVVTSISYEPQRIQYVAYDTESVQKLRLIDKPSAVDANGSLLNEVSKTDEPGWMWQPLRRGGILRVIQGEQKSVTITLPASPGILKFTNVNLRHTGSGSVNLAVRRTGGGKGAVSVDYATVDGSKTGTLSWGNGELGDRTAPIEIPSKFNRPGECFRVRLLNACGGAEINLPVTAMIHREGSTTANAMVDGRWTVAATAGLNGTITPAGNTSVADGAAQTFTITPAPGFRVSNLLVDGGPQGPLTSYTLKEVKAAHAIVASFTPAIEGLLERDLEK